MQNVDKYKDIEEKLPNLQPILLDAIQSDFLEIQSIDRTCDKYQAASAKIPELEGAYYVVYSKYIKKSDHRYEKFIFLDQTGHEVCNVSGQDMELYGLFNSCMSLSLNEAYAAAMEHEH